MHIGISQDFSMTLHGSARIHRKCSQFEWVATGFDAPPSLTQIQQQKDNTKPSHSDVLSVAPLPIVMTTRIITCLGMFRFGDFRTKASLGTGILSKVILKDGSFAMLHPEVSQLPTERLPTIPKQLKSFPPLFFKRLL